MKENKYDDKTFFDCYSKMSRSVDGLNGAGEWHVLKQMLPNLKDKRVLDLGCGYGWHCQYAIEQGAAHVVGVDLSTKMLEIARNRNSSPLIEYQCMAIEDYDFEVDTFDVVISSLTFHYLETFDTISKNINRCLTKGGTFVFSVEHPIFTAYGTQDWIYDQNGNAKHWPVDNYFTEGKRKANFLGEEVLKYHKTMTTYINSLIKAGFTLTGVVEPQPDETMMNIPGMQDELRRPMMLIVSAIK